jgi:hypothetical protein
VDLVLEVLLGLQTEESSYDDGDTQMMMAIHNS